MIFVATLLSLLQFGCGHYRHKGGDCCEHTKKESSCGCSKKDCGKEGSDSCEIKDGKKDEVKKDSK
jgi:hypothetical protein